METTVIFTVVLVLLGSVLSVNGGKSPLCRFLSHFRKEIASRQELKAKVQPVVRNTLVCSHQNKFFPQYVQQKCVLKILLQYVLFLESLSNVQRLSVT